MTIQQSLKDNEAQLVVDFKAHISWRFPAENTEEQMVRDRVDVVIGHLAYMLKDDFSNLLLTAMNIKAEGL